MNSNIKNKLTNLTHKSGVYQMLNSDGEIIYIGKAKNLKNRVSSYFNSAKQNNKTIAMVNKVVDFKVIVVETETKALLLENDLIKEHSPKYNILLKDSKSYPYISISNDKHPRVSLYRGTKNKKYSYFGPYPSVHIVKQSIDLLKKIFKLRSCSNSVYASRSRPCLEYQIGLCSAPCVDNISVENYQKDVASVENFLLGNSKSVLKEIEHKMNDAASTQEFELAAHYRNQMLGLRKIQEKHNVNTDFDIDFVFITQQYGIYCIQILFIRDGKQIDSETVFPKNAEEVDKEEVLASFLSLYYLDKIIPKTLAINCNVPDKKLIESALHCKIITRIEGDKKHFMQIAKLTAKESLKHFMLRKNRQHKQLQQLKEVLNMDKNPTHIECFDISHHHGEATVASCVVFKDGIPHKKSYRSFNIKDITAGDDFAAMRKAVFRRYKNHENIPDVLLIDGGIGQLNQAIMVFDSLGIDTNSQDCLIVGVTKGEGRKAGLETLILKEGEIVKKINLKPDDLALNLVNFVRDESHRFAITKHRNQFKRSRNVSVLEQIERIGIKKRQALLNYFGSVDEVKNAGVDELLKVDGISESIAIKIIDFFSNKNDVS